MHTKEFLAKQLEEWGVPRDRFVLVHTSLKEIGAVEGGGETVLSVLRDHITSQGGVLMIPTHTWDNFIEGAEFTLDLKNHVPCIGVLPRLAARNPDAIISENPTHSIAFFGEKGVIEEYVESERLVTTPASPVGCYGKLSQNGGSILLLGVDQRKNTFLHAMEEKFLGNIRYFSTPSTARIRCSDGSVVTRPFYAFDESEIGDVSERFDKFEAPFRHFGCIRDGVFGSAKTQLCSAEGMERAMKTIYERAGERELLADDSSLPEALYV